MNCHRFAIDENSIYGSTRPVFATAHRWSAIDATMKSYLTREGGKKGNVMSVHASHIIKEVRFLYGNGGSTLARPVLQGFTLPQMRWKSVAEPWQNHGRAFHDE
jgi:hypothetical protein